MRLRSRTLCAFDVLHSRGNRYMRELLQNDEEYILNEITRAGHSFGNLGIELTKEESVHVMRKIFEASKNGFFNEYQSYRESELAVHDYFKPTNTWTEFRNTFD